MKSSLGVKMVLRTLANLAVRKPICVSFEVTHSCNCKCQHCNRGSIKKEPDRMSLDDYRRISRELTPTACHLSGGEPLLRDDLEDVARAVKHPSGLPMMVLVSNWSLMTEERYLSMMDAGVDIFSVSLDFPDERHDKFRGLKGLYKKLDDIVPYLTNKYRLNNIVLNSALTSANFREVPGLVAKAEEWGARISISAYCILRTGEAALSITGEENLEVLKRNIEFLLEHKPKSRTVITPDCVIENTLRFFQGGGHLPNCSAGYRSIVVRPNGKLNPCSYFPEHQYDSQAEAIKGFSEGNTCDECYVSLRAMTERSLVTLTRDSIATYFKL